MTEPVSPPIVVANGDDCDFYRDVADAFRSNPAQGARVFDALGRRLVVGDGGLLVARDSADADELAELLRAWLGRMDAIRESTANWPLSLLIRASVDHRGFR